LKEDVVLTHDDIKAQVSEKNELKGNPMPPWMRVRINGYQRRMS